jgi:hypothetical protein
VEIRDIDHGLAVKISTPSAKDATSRQERRDRLKASFGIKKLAVLDFHEPRTTLQLYIATVVIVVLPQTLKCMKRWDPLGFNASTL